MYPSILTSHLLDLSQTALAPTPSRIKTGPTSASRKRSISNSDQLSAKQRMNPILTKLELPFRLLSLVQHLITGAH